MPVCPPDDGGCRTENMNDELATMLLRAVTGEDSVFMVVLNGPDQVAESQAGHFAVPTALDFTQRPWQTDDPHQGWINPCRWPPVLEEPAMQRVPRERILWITGYGEADVIRFVPERSNLQRVRPGPSTGFMERLLVP